MPYMQSAPAARTKIDGRWRDYFSGTGYLGLQGHPGLIDAAITAMREYGLTTATSRGGYGEHPVYDAVETAAARFLGEDRALYYVSAFLGSDILLEGLRDYERIFVDAQSHFSIRLGAQAAGRPMHLFPHRDPDGLNAAVQNELRPGERPLVLTDGVFPISGEIAPAPDYVEILSAYSGARLCLDDAHALGVLGPNGRGTVEHWRLQSENVQIHSMGTLSKAIGGHGGVIGGATDFIDRLWRFAAGPLTGSSPAPLPAAAASAWALDHIREHPELRRQLLGNVQRARGGFRKLGWPLAESSVPIICLDALGGLNLARIREGLFERDLCVAHVTRYSSTPAGGALRVAIFATHTSEQIDRLLYETAGLM